MSKSLNLAKELAHRNAVPFALIPSAYYFVNETPAHTFSTAVAPILDGEYCTAVLSRDFFDEQLAASVLKFVALQESILSLKKPVVILKGFACPHYSFNAVAVLSPAAAKQFEHENDVLKQRTFVAFPIYHCELSGDESPEIVDSIRHDLLPSLDWKRSPCPKVTMWFRNKRNKTGSQPLLAKLTTVLREVEELNGSEGSWVEVENYAGRRCRVEWSQENYTVGSKAQKITPIDKKVLIDHFTAFLLNDQDLLASD